ncbi:patatin-like phospholipase family protein [Calidifontibacter indicus]|uniref:NTE family protein n=1 Tax=Calidifontibacter indicus TaxID=419650 RepID=A0A3D9UKB2_9MICO|nr:patatin-like phospholipase family protein [Calidifontibacter indicus]REF29892.1 NTE family protein [Calidifontibacter indicus]
MASGKRVAVALGSGGAHIGALEVLAERGHEVVTIAGTSMGALVGSFAASGRMEVLKEWALSLSQRDLLRLVDPSLGGPGVVRAERIINRIGDMLADSQIEDFPIPFTAVATDLDGRREVWFQRGPADVAIRASSAMPGVIHPVVVDGRMLVDGGLMNPIPIEPTRAVASDITLAISLNGVRQSQGNAEAVPVSPLRTIIGSSETLTRGARRVRKSTNEILETATMQRLSARLVANRAAQEDDPDADPLQRLLGTRLPKDPSTMEIFNRSFDTMSSLVARYRMASNPPDVLVTLPSDAARTLEFHRAAEMIALGRQLTTEALDAQGL